MEFARLTIAQFRQMGRDHGVMIVVITLLHLLTNAAFAAFATSSARIIHFGPGADPQAFVLICNAPLTASMAVLIATLALRKATPRDIINKSFFVNWVIVTLLFAWSNGYAWFTSETLTWRLAPVFIHYPPLTDWLDLGNLVRKLPTFLNIMISTIVILSVPIMVMRRQPLFRSNALVAVAMVAGSTTFFLLLDRGYRAVIDEQDIYQHWLEFPGYNPFSIGNDQLLVDIVSLPVSLPAWIVTTLLATAAVKAAIAQRESLRQQKLAQTS